MRSRILRSNKGLDRGPEQGLNQNQIFVCKQKCLLTDREQPSTSKQESIN